MKALNRHWLATYKILVETGSFTRTADLSFMTQPGVSQQLKKLELACGHALLIRLGKGIELTEQGRLVYEHAVRVHLQEDELAEQLAFDNPYQGVCTLACSGAISQRIYPTLLALQKQHPALVINLEVAPHNVILNSIQNGDIDLGIVTRMPDESLFACSRIGVEKIGLILPADVTLDDDLETLLSSLGMVHHPDAHHYKTLCLPALEKLGVKGPFLKHIRNSGYVNQFSQILLPVSRGLGFTFLPTGPIGMANERMDIQVYPFQQSVEESLYQVTSPHRQLPSRYEHVVDAISMVLSDKLD